MATTLKDPESISDYSQLCSLACGYAQGWLHQKQNFREPVATVIRTSRAIDEDRSRSSVDVMLCCGDENMVNISSQSLDVAKPLVYDMSPSGWMSVALHNAFYGSSGAKEEKHIIEVTRSGFDSFRIDASNMHGAFMGDSWFGGSSWSKDERFFAYVAMTKVDKPQTYFGSQSYSSGATTASASSSKYNYTEDWGERFAGVSSLGIFVLDVSSQRIHKIGGIDTTLWTVGQPCLITSNDGGVTKYLLGYTAFSSLPRKLGVVYCFQRPHSIFLTDITSVLLSPSNTQEVPPLCHVLLSSGLKTARSLRCNPDGSRVVFLGQEKGFEEHNGCSELFTAEVSALISGLASKSSEVLYGKVVAQVDAPLVTLGVDRATVTFPGIYSEALPVRCFSSPTTIVLASQWASDIVMISIDLIRGVVLPLLPQPSGGSSAVLDVAGSMVLYAHSAPTSPARLHVFDISSNLVRFSSSVPVQQAVRLLRAGANGEMENRHPSAASQSPELCVKDGVVSGLSWKVFSHVTDGILFESILIYPSSARSVASRSAKGIPIILVPHGGPHSCMSTGFFHAYAFLAHQLGSAVLHVNYRGSPGFGQASIHSLPGHVGRNDVADMMSALAHALTLRVDPTTALAVCASSSHSAHLPALADSSRVSVVGGSHGGFLAGHLIGQYPDVFKAAAMRNPVTNIAGEFSVSDIPDWCVVEACGHGVYDFSSYTPPSDEVLLKMRSCSPIHYVRNVRAPTLICLGGKDRRVPPSQGLEYHHILKAQGVETRVMVFPEDNHPIDKPASEAEHWLAIADWILTHV